MADIGVNYDLQYTPRPVRAGIRLYMSGNEVRIRLDDVPRVLVNATPHYTANPISGLLSTVGTPLVNVITMSLGLFATEALQGQNFEAYTIKDLSVDIQGVKATLKPKDIGLGNHGGMLMITGDFDIV